MLVDQGDDDDAGSTLVAALDNLPAATAGWEQTLTTTKPRPAAKSHASPEESRRRRLTECERVEKLLVHGSRLPTLLVVRSCVVSNSLSLGKRFRYLKKIFEISGWPSRVAGHSILEGASAAIESDELANGAHRSTINSY
jgi:hypothetical protein